MRIFFQAQLHLSAHEPVAHADVDLYIRTGSYEADGADDEARRSKEHSARRDGSSDLAKAVRREIRLLIKEVRTAKQRGAPVKAFRPAAAQSAAAPPPVPTDSAGGKEKWKANGARGLEFLRTSAHLGFADAQVELGNLLVSGKYLKILPARRSTLVAGNLVEVTPLLGQAESNANTLAEEGIEWYQHAARNDHPDAWFNLGMLHFSGDFVQGGLKVPGNMLQRKTRKS